MTERVLSFAEALGEVLRQAASVGAVGDVEAVTLAEAAGRVLARSIAADRDQPPFDRSTRDGFAVRLAPTSQNRDVGHPDGWRLLGSVRAGESWQGDALREGEAVEIMTGAPVPAGADAVVMVEHTSVAEGTLKIEAGRTLKPGENIVPRGAEARAGATLLPVGRVLGAAEIAVAASCGCAEVRVFARPKVAIVATGDELVELPRPGEAAPALSKAQIFNSNSHALRALATAEGAFARGLQIARDTRADLIERIAQASMWDLMLLSGGVSMGKYDLVEEVLTEFGAEFFFTGALIQPGKPIIFGRIPARSMFQTDEEGRPFVPPLDQPWQGRWTYFFGLPGNPVSTQVCFHLFVAPMLRALAGRTEIAPQFVEARLAEAVKGGAKVTRFLPAELNGTWDGVTVRVVGWQGSGDVAANARGNCYAVLPAGVDAFAAGETVRVLLR
jgi:molybdopterin molybdotransferase